MHKTSLTTLFLTLFLVLGVQSQNSCGLEDSFLDKISTDLLSRIQDFSIEYHSDYKIVANKRHGVEYRLDCKDSGAGSISLTQEKFLSASLESLGFLELLGVVSKINGIYPPEDATKVTSACVRKQLETKNSTLTNLIFSTTNTPEAVVIGLDENMAPLEKAQWILYVGAILNLDGLAQQKYQEIEASYNCHRDNLSKVNKQQIAWITSNDNSYTFKNEKYYNTLIKDAGGSPIDVTQATYNDPTEFHKKMENAVFAIDETVTKEISMKTWLKQYKFEAKNKPYHNNLYRTDKLINNATVSDWTQTSPSRPDLALQDLISVQYGDYQRTYSPKWLIKLTTGFQRNLIDSECTSASQEIPKCTPYEYIVRDIPKYNDSSSGKKTNTGAIAGGVVGGVVGVLAIGGIVFYGRKKYRKTSPQNNNKQGWDFISLKSGRSTTSLA